MNKELLQEILDNDVEFLNECLETEHGLKDELEEKINQLESIIESRDLIIEKLKKLTHMLSSCFKQKVYQHIDDLKSTNQAISDDIREFEYQVDEFEDILSNMHEAINSI